MAKPNLIAIGSYFDWDVSAMDARYTVHPVSSPEALADLPEDLRNDARAIAFKGHAPLGAAQMDLLPQLGLIANYGVGFDHIDVKAAQAKGISVSNTPGVLTDATADLALTLILMAARRAGEGERELRSGNWSGWRPTHLIGSALKDKVLGVVGFGRIGVATAERARHGFGMKIAYYARGPKDEAAPLNAEFCPDLDDLLAKSDFVSLHVPGGGETANLIDAEALAVMKPGSYLINTARGGVVDHEALADALKSGHLAGAGLDVYPDEPKVPEALLGLENVVLLPHLGSANAETREAMGMRALRNIEAFAKGDPLPDPVA